jgi:hypothetical protein
MTIFCMWTFAVSATEVRGQQSEVGQTKTQIALPAATVKEQLPDGSYIVAINGTSYKAIDAGTLHGILKTNEEADKALRARAALEKQIALYEDNLLAMKQLVAIADAQRSDEIGIAANYKTLYLGEHDLRLKAEKLYAPPGRVSGFFQNPVVQLAEKIGKPIFENWLASRNRQTTVVMTYDQVALLQLQQRGRPNIVLKL